MPDYKKPLKSIGDFIKMSYDSLTEEKVEMLRGLFILYDVKNYLEYQFKQMNEAGVEKEDIFLGTWRFIHDDMPELKEDIEKLKNYKGKI